MRLDGKVAVITGGAKGIGLKTAERFMKEGAKVVIADFDPVAGYAAVAGLDADDRVRFIEVDVTSTEQVENMVTTTIDAYGRLDILINNAGITIDGFLTKLEDSAWEQVIAVNLTGVYKCTKAAVPVMISQGEGVIINASSVVGVYGNIGQTNYAATKAGVIGMTKSWAKELGPKGIRVNAVAPGFIVTDMTAKVPRKVLDIMASRTPLKKLGRPEDVAAAYLFLVTEDASFINGVVLSVDGGLIL